MKIQIKQQSFLWFWLVMASEYLLLSEKAAKMLLPILTAYLCETATTPHAI